MFVVVHFGVVSKPRHRFGRFTSEGFWKSSFSVVGFGNPVVFLADGLGVGLVGGRGCEDGEVEVEEGIWTLGSVGSAVSFGEMD
jgi:hypothetical protein